MDAKKYQEDRFREAFYEVDLAERFLQYGLMRNAAGKAYQAIKAYVAGLAVDRRDELAKHYPGTRRLGPNKVIDRVDWLITVMLSSRFSEVASIIGDKELRLYVEIALNLHEFQYNGLDRYSEVSRYTSEELVKKDITEVINFIRNRLKNRI
ncbi:PaREP1 family protein [Vulcanisaeta sp. JCM 16159]|uniref:PaREP1 family protein n=1 Tax=Vulcanisaeta sp. JCM 16159 TaxID=1295371 RepID=UPI0006D13878|nr:PaREP1 family protein [Vulcanisaeta sp. JCM 16159]